MTQIEQVSLLLKDLRLKAVADATGIHINTLDKIRKGVTKDPSYSTMMKLRAYFEQFNEVLNDGDK